MHGTVKRKKRPGGKYVGPLIFLFAFPFIICIGIYVGLGGEKPFWGPVFGLVTFLALTVGIDVLLLHVLGIPFWPRLGLAYLISAPLTFVAAGLEIVAINFLFGYFAKTKS